MKTTKKNKGGRPSKYNPKFCDDIIKHFTVPAYIEYVKSERITTKSNGTKEVYREYGRMANDMPTIEGFARKIGVDDDTVGNWAKEENKEKYPGFFGAYNRCKSLQREFLSSIGLKGLAPPASFIFVTKNVTDWKDKQEVDTKHSGNVTWTEEPPK